MEGLKPVRAQKQKTSAFTYLVLYRLSRNNDFVNSIDFYLLKSLRINMFTDEEQLSIVQYYIYIKLYFLHLFNHSIIKKKHLF